MSLRTAIASLFKPVHVPDSSGDSSVNRNFSAIAAALQKLGAIIDDAIPTPGEPTPQSRVFVEAATGIGPWTFSTFDPTEPGLLGYEFELAIVDPTTDVVLRINGDTGANYGRIGGAARTSVFVGTNPGGPPGGVRGVVELRGVATGLVRTIGVARVTSFESTTPVLAANPGDACWTGVAALASVSIFATGGAAAASSAVSLFKIMEAA